MKLPLSVVKRGTRLLAFALASGILFLGAGNVLGFEALDSALFGAIGALSSLVAVLLFVYAAKGEVPDKDFDSAIHQAIEKVQSKE